MPRGYVLDLLPKDHYGQPLVCSGCAHSAAGAPFPGHPSGERPCCFCIRNPDRAAYVAECYDQGRQPVQVWYDQSKPVKVPMDCYHSVDMKRQIEKWGEEKDQT